MSETIDKPVAKHWFESAGRLYQHRIRDLSLLRRLSDAISLELGVQEAVQYVLEILIDELDVCNGSIMLYNEESEYLELRCVTGQSEDAPRVISSCLDGQPTGLRLRSGEGIAGTAHKNAEPILIQDTDRDPRFIKYADQALAVGSLLCLPLVIRHKTVGVINLSHSEKYAFDEADMHGLAVVTNQIAMALDNNENYQKIRMANIELEHKVRERTQHLEQANKELQQTRSSLIQSERLKALGQMASGVAHDFNNTLAGIIGNTQLLLRETDDEQIRERLQSVELAAKDGASTVRRIQEFSRIHVNSESELEALDLNQVIQDTIRITRPLWKDQAQNKGKTVKLTTRLGCIAPIQGNAAELREVLTNIVLNALDAMNGSGEIVVSSWQQGEEVFLAISDTGPGMTDETKGKLFDPFYTTKGPTNSGLGLSVAFGIIHRHNGTIEVQSICGKGTTFVIQLPQSLEPIKTVVEETPEHIPNAKILLVDDDRFVRESICMVLQHLGHTVSAATNGQDAIDQFAGGDFDLVFTDLGMPGLSGWDVAAGVKALNASVPVVLMTGWGRELDANEINSRGVDFLVTKPFEVNTIAGVLAAALGHQG